MMLVGEVHTGLLRNSSALTAGQAAALLGLKPGLRVRHGERPTRFAISPNLLTGVDCTLASAEAMPRGIGTVSSRATVIGGQMLLSSSHAAVVTARTSHRQPWAYYLARPGVVEAVGRCRPEAMGAGFLRAAIPPPTLDLGAMNARVVKQVQSRPDLDARPAFRAQSTRLRWVALPGSADGQHVFGLHHHSLRTVELRTAWEDPEELVALCEDIALHDWLLTTIVKLIDHSMIGSAPRREVIGRLLPAVDFMLHLWMPGARLGERSRQIWQSLEHSVGFTRQWQASVDRIRDQLSLATITRLLSHHSVDHS